MNAVSRYLDPALVERLNHLQLSARRVVEGATTGQHRSPVKGASVEFRQHRFYTPGDEPRRLDWRVLARTDRTYIKEYDEETNLRAMLLLDASGSMAYGRLGGSKFDYAARLAASLAYLMLGQTESVGLGLMGARLQRWSAPHAGHAQLSRLIDTLEHSAPARQVDFSTVLQEAADRLDRRALVIIISDFLSPSPAIRQALARLRHDKHEMICLRVLDRDEVEFPFHSWSRFRGMEGEAAHICEPALARKLYLDKFAGHRTQLEHDCRAVGAELHPFLTDQPLLDNLTYFLRRRADRRQ